MRGGSICPSRASVSSAGPVDSDSTVESQNKGGGLLAQSPDHGGSVVVPERKDMPEFVVTALLAPSRLSLKLLRALVMSLVYLAALVAAFVYSCIALTHVMCRPRRGCCGRQRLSPPECLRDPTLGEHCFLTLRVSVPPVKVGFRGRMRIEERRLKCRIWNILGCSSLGRKLPYFLTLQLLLRLGPSAEFRPASALCLCWSWQWATHAISAWLPRELVCLGPWILMLTGLGKGRVLTMRYLGNGNR